MQHMYTRRQWAKVTVATLTANHLAAKMDSRFNGVELGVQTYSFREMPLNAAISAMQEIGIGSCELFMGHVEPAGLVGVKLKQWRLSTPMSYFTNIKNKFDTAGIRLFAYSLNFRDEISDEEIDRGFQQTKALGTDLITTSTTLTCARRLVEPMKKYGVRVALHGHDETDKPNEFSTPESFARGLSLSPQFLINLDIGHFSAAGFDPVQFVEEHHQKIACLHIKDRKKNHGPGTPFGLGNTPIKPVLLLLKKKEYPIAADIEYEYNDDIPGLNTVAEVKKCFDYCKAVLRQG